MSDESILSFHARCRELFLRAYPREPTEGRGLARSLRRVFTWGLSNQRIAVYVWDRRPDTYAECLQRAQEKHSTEQLCKETRRSGGGLHALNQAPEEDGRAGQGPPTTKGVCHGCGNPGHYIRQCPAIKKAKEMGICQMTRKRKEKPKGKGKQDKGRNDKKGVHAMAGSRESPGQRDESSDNGPEPAGNAGALSL